MKQTAELRSTGIGGSDAAVILGLSPWKTPLQLAVKKLGPDHPVVAALGLDDGEGRPDKPWLEAGKRLEDVVARWYADETGSKIRRNNQTLRLKELPHIMAHVDREVMTKRKVLECKTTNAWAQSKWGDSGTHEIPDYYYAQVQHYLLFPQYDSADLALLMGGNDFRIYPDIEPDIELQEIMLEEETKFWEMLQRGELPDPSTADDARLLWRREEVEKKEATPYIDALSAEYKDLKRDLKLGVEKAEELQGEIMAFMGDAGILMDVEGKKKLHSWKEQFNNYFDEDKFVADAVDGAITGGDSDLLLKYFRKSIDRKKLKADHPDLYKKYQGKDRRFR